MHAFVSHHNTQPHNQLIGNFSVQSFSDVYRAWDPGDILSRYVSQPARHYCIGKGSSMAYVQVCAYA
jgi:hypothetical protein